MKRFLMITGAIAALALLSSTTNATAGDHFHGGHHGHGGHYGHGVTSGHHGVGHGGGYYGHGFSTGHNRVTPYYGSRYHAYTPTYRGGFYAPHHPSYLPAYRGHGGLHLDVGRLHIGVGHH